MECIFLLHWRTHMQLSQIVLVCEFDIIVEFIIAGGFCKLKRGAVPEHERIEGIAVEVCDLFYDITGEPVVDEFVLLVFNQPGLECSETPVSFEPEHID